MSGITSAGVGSGIDLESVIKAEVAAAYTYKYQKLQEDELTNELQISAWGTLKAGISTFNETVEKLTSSDDFSKMQLKVNGAKAEESPILDFVSANRVTQGSFALEVKTLAQSNQLQSTFFASPSEKVGAGSLTFSAGSESFSVSISADDTLTDIRDAINAASGNSSINANIVNTKNGAVLVYDNAKTGTANALTVTTSDASLNQLASTGMTETRAANNAVISLNNMDIESDTNTFQNAVDGLSFTVKQVTTTPATLAVERDDESTRELIKDFIESYNSLVNGIKRLSNPLLSKNPATDGGGALAFDPAVRSFQRQLTQAATTYVSSNPQGMQSLYDLGIELQNDGTLTQKSTSRLDTALSSYYDDVQSLFGNADGIGTKIASLVDNYLESGGVIASTEEAQKEKRSDIEDERIRLDEEKAAFEASLRQRYAALDSTVAGYQAQLQYVSSMNFDITSNKS